MGIVYHLRCFIDRIKYRRTSSFFKLLTDPSILKIHIVYGGKSMKTIMSSRNNLSTQKL